jgi:hypothetical protein
VTHDELLAKINDPIELSRYLDKGIADKSITKNQAQIYWFNTNALRAVVELHKPSGIFCRGCGFIEEYNEPAQLLPCPTIQAIEKELG